MPLRNVKQPGFQLTNRCKHPIQNEPLWIAQDGRRFACACEFDDNHLRNLVPYVKGRIDKLLVVLNEANVEYQKRVKQGVYDD